ncbi:MAG: HD domain-containing phosphohydrolase, partial [Calditrichota bacterium]
IRAVEVGANDFIAKPFDYTEISVRTASLLRMKEAHDSLKRHKLELEGMVQKRTESLRRALDNMVETQRRLHEAQLETIQRLVAAAEFKDQNTASHIKRMSRFSALLASNCGFSKGETELLLYASPMHDIGKIGTPEDILLKPSKLSEDEWPLMKQHTLIGADILKESSSELLQAGEVIALTHHERWDGSGYPHGLAGEDIPLWGRICAVTDVFDALTSERPYKPAYSNETAIKVLREGAGKHFDSNLVGCFLNNLDEVENVQREINSPQPAAV